jgi:serine/threonine protein kinase
MRITVGRYAITGTLGDGGMGVVYSAYDDRLGRPIAIKMIKSAVAQADARDGVASDVAGNGDWYSAVCGAGTAAW